MASVTSVVNKVKRPGTNYIKLSDFGKQQLKSKEKLYPTIKENIHASITGLAVDYLTRFLLCGDAKEAFSISYNGAVSSSLFNKDEKPLAQFERLLKKVKGLDDASIKSACKICTFDVWYRNPIGAMCGTKGVKETNPNQETITNIRIMVERCKDFFKKYGPVTKLGFDFNPNGYSKTIDAGDGDYLTKDTLWDLKVSKHPPNCHHALQLLTYWVMGQHSGQDVFKNITKIGIYNPRLNIVYTCPIWSINKYIIRDVEDDIICY